MAKIILVMMTLHQINNSRKKNGEIVLMKEIKEKMNKNKKKEEIKQMPYLVLWVVIKLVDYLEVLLKNKIMRMMMISVKANRKNKKKKILIIKEEMTIVMILI